MKVYIKPTISEIKVDSDIIRMLSKDVRVVAELFWERFGEERKNNPRATQEAVWDVLNEKYMSVIGCSRYKDFESFRQVRDRGQRKKIKEKK